MIKKAERMLKNFYLEMIGPIRPMQIIYTIFQFLRYPYPKNVTFEVTNSCNLKCAMCPQPYMRRNKGFMDFNFYKKIIGQIENKVKEVSLYSTGEPFLHPKLCDMIKYAKLKGIPHVQTSTNATLLNERNAKLLLSSGLDFLQISIEGENKEKYEKIRKGANFEKVRENLKNLILLRNKNKKPTIDIHLLLYEDTNPRKFVEIWGDYCDRMHVSSMNPIRLFNKDKGTMGFIKPKDVELYELSSKSIGCLQPFHTIAISYDGKVGLCCGDFDFDLVMGDTKKERLIDIYNNKLYKQIRRKFLFKNFDDTPCKGCPSLYRIKDEKLVYKTQVLVNKLMKSKKANNGIHK